MVTRQHKIEPPLQREFFARDTLTVARDLVGSLLVDARVDPVRRLRLVEVEAYIGEDDPACHAASGRTERNAVMYGPPGFAYLYFIYGMYHCLNVVTEAEGFPAAVLIRGAELVSGSLEPNARTGRPGASDGPGKLCLALELDRRHNGLDLTSGAVYLAAGEGKPTGLSEIATSPRIGISSATDRLWRFFDPHSPCVSGPKAGSKTRNLRRRVSTRRRTK